MTGRQPGWQVVEDATVVPSTTLTARGEDGRPAYDGGVYDAAGQEVAIGRHTLGFMTHSPAPRRPIAPPEKIRPGTTLFGGWLRTHFGNFIEESLGRLWAIREAGIAFDRIAFVLYGGWNLAVPRANHGANVLKLPFVAEVLRLLDIDCPVDVLTRPARFERLIVPELLALRAVPDRPEALARHKGLLASMADMLSTEDVPEKVYISRARLPIAMSRFILEDVLEANLRRSGYAIVYPETLSLGDQVRLYRGARRLIIAEGSPIHLAAAFCGERARVVVLGRRWPIKAKFGRQLTDGGAMSVHTIVALEGAVGQLDESGRRIRSHGNTTHVLPDLAAVGAALEEMGLVKPGRWHVPTDAEVEAAITQAILAKQALNDGETYGYIAEPHHRIVQHVSRGKPPGRFRAT